MAWYPKAARRELPQNRTARSISPRSIALHTAVSNGSTLYAFFSGRSGGVESHFYVTETGTVEQYMDTAKRADCQLDGNAYAVSIETWDGAGDVWDARNVNRIPPWNAKQVEALVELMAWICRTHNIPATKCPRWDGRGIGYHAQFTGGAKRWNEHHACPGPTRIRQVPTLIAQTKAALDGAATKPAPAQEEDDLTPEQATQLAEIHDQIATIGSTYRQAKLEPDRYEDIQAKLSRVREDNVTIKAQLEVLTEQVQALAVLINGRKA